MTSLVVTYMHVKIILLRAHAHANQSKRVKSRVPKSKKHQTSMAK